MPHSADDPSLSERIRSLAMAPDFKEILLELDKRTRPPDDHAAEFEEMLNRAGGAPYRGPRGPKHKRDRHGMYGIKGGLAACAPLAFLAHNRAHIVTTAGALAAGAALTVPTVAAVSGPAAPLPHPPAIIVPGHHHAREQPGLMPWQPVTAAHHASRRRAAADDDDAVRVPPSGDPTPTPTPSASPSWIPSPSPSPAASGNPGA